MEILLILVVIFLAWIFPVVIYPEFLIYPYLEKAGWSPYVQIIDHHFPGAIFFPINFSRLGFFTERSFHLLIAGLSIWTALWIYIITKNKLAPLVYALWNPIFEGSHLWFEKIQSAFVLPAFWSANKRKFLVAGLLLGVAVTIKQTNLVLVAAVVLYEFLFCKLTRTEWYRLMVGLAFPIVLVAKYILSRSTLQAFWHWTVLFNFQTYAVEAFKLPNKMQILPVLIFVGLMLAFSNFLKSKKVLVWAVACALGITSRFELRHFQAVFPLLVILVPFVRSDRLRLVLAIISVVVLLLWKPVLPNFFSEDYVGLAQVITAQSQNGVFLIGSQPHLYVLSHTYPSTQTFVFWVPWLVESVQDRILEDLVLKPPGLIVFDPNSRVDGRSITQFAPKLVQYIQANYVATATVSGQIFYKAHESRH